MTSKEQLQPKRRLEFTERERLYDRLSDVRFQALLVDEQTTIHEAELSSNSYGEFLFVTLSRPQAEKTEYLTFYGLGYHEYRERWITEVWSWFRAMATPKREAARLTYEEVGQVIAERLAAIRPDLDRTTQSSQGRFYEFLAELTDEDGAISEIEDLSDLAEWLFGEEDEPE